MHGDIFKKYSETNSKYGKEYVLKVELFEKSHGEAFLFLS